MHTPVTVMALSPAEAEMVEMDRRRRLHTGQWWLTPEGREYAKDCFDDTDVALVYLIELERLENFIQSCGNAKVNVGE